MQISQILSEYALKSQKRDIQVRRIQGEPVKTLFKDDDKVEISGNLTPDRLAELKNRINSGFYMTKAVTDDLSNKMSGLFDDLTE